ncbi:UDP-glycosyltransferase 90A1 [Sesamum angolense]|uniref:Glycosyltransferase n=1 Tax=Sesamum angolense TaxID=2727404 RepID=A0AAE2BYR1_9LAMI|nr:UDP-glycosyltransferase 90A1 [Sesamum angolense]
MSQGHTIPLLSLSRLLRRRSAVVTIFTTSKNSPRIRASLQDVDVSILELPFPGNIDGVPPGVENTDRLPSMACFLPFAKSTKLMQKSFEQALETLRPPVSCIISDGFLGWTQKSAEKMGIPRLVFIGMGNYSCTMYQILGRDRPQADTHSPDEPFPIPDFPTVKLTRNDFDPPFNDLEPSGPVVEFMMEQLIATSMSRGVLVDSFYELESRYVDYWNKKIGPKAFNIGPLCMAAEPSSPPEALEKPSYMQWLDERLAKGEPVLYVAFGSQAEVAEEQLQEIAKGLEQSHVSFLWVLKSRGAVECLQKFEEKVKNRGMVVKEWVDQRGILRHGGVKGFLSHCGWNSVMESISAGVPLLALPLMAEQHMNARFVAEEIGVGLRIMPRGGTVRGFVEAEEVERVVREMMEGEKGVEVRRKAVEYGGASCAAMAEGGSSWRTLDLVVADVSVFKSI